jgi:hypothetical protein
MWVKFHHFRFTLPEIAWWAWPILLVAGVALNLGFFAWLAMFSTEARDVDGAKEIQGAVWVVLALLVFL